MSLAEKPNTIHISHLPTFTTPHPTPKNRPAASAMRPRKGSRKDRVSCVHCMFLRSTCDGAQPACGSCSRRGRHAPGSCQYPDRPLTRRETEAVFVRVEPKDKNDKVRYMVRSEFRVDEEKEGHWGDEVYEFIAREVLGWDDLIIQELFHEDQATVDVTAIAELDDVETNVDSGDDADKNDGNDIDSPKAIKQTDVPLFKPLAGETKFQTVVRWNFDKMLIDRIVDTTMAMFPNEKEIAAWKKGKRLIDPFTGRMMPDWNGGDEDKDMD